MKKYIFGKIVEISLNNSKFGQILSEELDTYDDASGETEILIRLVNELPFNESLTNNPREYYELEDSVIFGVGYYYVRWYKETDLIQIDLLFSEPKFPSLLNIAYKFKDIQYNLPYQKAGQIFHELVLYPLLYLLEDYSLIHSSAFIKDNKTYILGGTGGTGKTSLSMKLCKQSGYGFIADDILPITKDRFYCNYAYPKIYAYNTIDNKSIEKELLHNDDLFGRLQWYMLKRLSVVRVRRRVNPVLFYNYSNQNTCGSLNDQNVKYIILSRGNYTNISLEKVTDTNLVVEMTLNIILTEMSQFNNLIHFHNYNAVLSNLKTSLNLGNIIERKKTIYKEFFRNTDNYILQIPRNISHKKYIDESEKLISKL